MDAQQVQEPQNEEEAIQQVYEYAAHLMLNEEKTAAQAKAQLVEEGLDEEIAQVVVTNLEQQLAEAKKERASKDILYGSLWLIGGIVVTVLTYSAASGGGRYVVTWGAIIFGAVQLIKGLSNR